MEIWRVCVNAMFVTWYISSSETGWIRVQYLGFKGRHKSYSDEQIRHTNMRVYAATMPTSRFLQKLPNNTHSRLLFSFNAVHTVQSNIYAGIFIRRHETTRTIPCHPFIDLKWATTIHTDTPTPNEARVNEYFNRVLQHIWYHRFVC